MHADRAVWSATLTNANGGLSIISAQRGQRRTATALAWKIACEVNGSELICVSLANLITGRTVEMQCEERTE
jgi:hypothetical protein